uniref:Uncharacterized protein n=1 Tax=Bionectria ochroleuca TaxID=29856 RepID=A0A8H7NKP3_BIOOC
MTPPRETDTDATLMLNSKHVAGPVLNLESACAIPRPGGALGPRGPDLVVSR